MKVAFYTLGCKVNQSETNALARLFLENGFETAAQSELADVYVVNSCTVTSVGDKKSRQWLRKAKRQNPNAVTVLTGCYPQAFAKKAAELKEADVITGTRAKGKIVDHVLESMQTGARIVDVSQHESGDLFEELPVQRQTMRTRAFVKIEDGCDRRCAYCIIPYARGKVRSRTEQSILKEVEELSLGGCAEVVLTGINLSSYGKDTGTDIADIVKKVADLPHIKSIRLGSLEPDMMTDDIIERLSRVDKLCAHFHLALQSGCDDTLKRMRRPYTTAQYAQIVQKMRSAMPGATFMTDVIVGFAGESEEEFEASLKFVCDMQFLKVHVFAFSKREGTPANDMPMQVDEPTKHSRSKIMQQRTDEVRKGIIDNMYDSTVQILLEQPISKDVYTGYTAHYVPVVIAASGTKQGDIVTAVLKEYDGNRCKAVLAKQM